MKSLLAMAPPAERMELKTPVASPMSSAAQAMGAQVRVTSSTSIPGQHSTKLEGRELRHAHPTKKEPRNVPAMARPLREVLTAASMPMNAVTQHSQKTSCQRWRPMRFVVAPATTCPSTVPAPMVHCNELSKPNTNQKYVKLTESQPI